MIGALRAGVIRAGRLGTGRLKGTKGMGGTGINNAVPGPSLKFDDPTNTQLFPGMMWMWGDLQLSRSAAPGTRLEEIMRCDRFLKV